MTFYCVIRQKVNDGEWDPDERVGDPDIAAIVVKSGQPSEAIRLDATRVLASRGFSEKDDREVFERFVESAISGEWCRPAGDMGDEAWRWTVASFDIRPRDLGIKA